MATQDILRHTIAAAREKFSELLNLANYKNYRIEIVKRNKTVAYIVSKEDFELLTRIEDYLDAKEADEIIKSSEGTIPHKEMFKEFGL